jgi:hypothetical protein
MSPFKKLTCTDGRVVWINRDLMTAMMPYGQEGRTTVFFEKDNAINVKEPPEDIIA